jgi:hypothetical protein
VNKPIVSISPSLSRFISDVNGWPANRIFIDQQQDLSGKKEQAAGFELRLRSSLDDVFGFGEGVQLHGRCGM